MRRRSGVLVAVAAFVVVLVGVAFGVRSGVDRRPAPMAPPFVASPDDQVPPTTPGVEQARALLQLLPRAEARVGQEPFREEAFGRPWADPDRNGCDSRQDAFKAWLGSSTATASCKVSGIAWDPYTGRSLAIPDEAVLDLVVSLRQAWRSGADRWSADKRIAFANDPGNLVPTTEASVVGKAGDGADGWMPPQASYWCEYARSYVGTKSAYSLTVTRDEAQALETALSTCGPSTISTA